MLDKSKAPRCKDYINLDFIVRAIAELNNGSNDKYYLRVYEYEEERTAELQERTSYVLAIEIACKNVKILTKKIVIDASLKQPILRNMVMNMCAQVITDCIGSGLVNYRLATDALTESYGQEVMGQDRVSIIRKIVKYPADNTPGKLRRWVKDEGFSLTHDNAVCMLYRWEVIPMLDATYEDLLKCLKELQDENGMAR